MSGPKLTKRDYDTGFIIRYFIKKANDKNAITFEISKSDYKKNLTMFNKTKINWKLTGTKEEVVESNLLTINNVNKVYKGIDTLLYPLQYWKPPKNSPEDIAKKMLFMKTS